MASSNATAAAAALLPNIRYLDDFVRLKCAPDLLAMGLFPDAKEITESMACWMGVRQVTTMLAALEKGSGSSAGAGRAAGAGGAAGGAVGAMADASGADASGAEAYAGGIPQQEQLDDAIVVVGDGTTPRTAALCAFLAGSGRRSPAEGPSSSAPSTSTTSSSTSQPMLPPAAPGRAWRFISIDPIMHYDSAADKLWLRRHGGGPGAPRATMGGGAVGKDSGGVGGGGGGGEGSSRGSGESKGSDQGADAAEAGTTTKTGRRRQGASACALTPAQAASWASSVRGLTMSRARIQEVTIRARRAIIVLMHAHVTFADVVAALDLTDGLVGAVVAPCCQWEPHLRHLFGRLADTEGADPCMLSEKNLMRVWAQPPRTRAALFPMEGCPINTLLVDGSSPSAFELGLRILARLSTKEGAAAAEQEARKNRRERRLRKVVPKGGGGGGPGDEAGDDGDDGDDGEEGEEASAEGPAGGEETGTREAGQGAPLPNLPSSAAIASIVRPKDRRLAYRTARKLAFAQTQARMRSIPASAGLVESAALLTDGLPDESADGPAASVDPLALLTQYRSRNAVGTTALRARKGQAALAGRLLHDILVSGRWGLAQAAVGGGGAAAPSTASASLPFSPPVIQLALPAGQAAALMHALQHQVIHAATAAAAAASATEGALRVPAASFEAVSAAAAGVRNRKEHAPRGEVADGRGQAAGAAGSAADAAGDSSEPAAVPAAAIRISSSPLSEEGRGEGDGTVASGGGIGYEVALSAEAFPFAPSSSVPGGPCPPLPTWPDVAGRDGCKRIDAAALSQPLRLLTVGVVTAVRILSTLVFYDLRDLSSAASLPAHPLPPMASAPASAMSEAPEPARLQLSSLSALFPQGADSFWPLTEQHSVEMRVSGRGMKLGSTTFVMAAGQAAGEAEAARKAEAEALAAADAALAASAAKEASAGKPNERRKFGCRSAGTAMGVPPASAEDERGRLQVCVAKPLRWAHPPDAEAAAGAARGMGGSGAARPAAECSPASASSSSSSSSFVPCPDMDAPPLPVPADAAWLAALKPGDIVLLEGPVGRGFSRHANFFLCATRGLLLFDSVSRLDGKEALELVSRSSEKGAEGAEEEEEADGREGEGGGGGGAGVTADGSPVVYVTPTGQYVRRRPI